MTPKLSHQKLDLVSLLRLTREIHKGQVIYSFARNTDRNTVGRERQGVQTVRDTSYRCIKERKRVHSRVKDRKLCSTDSLFDLALVLDRFAELFIPCLG